MDSSADTLASPLTCPLLATPLATPLATLLALATARDAYCTAPALLGVQDYASQRHHLNASGSQKLDLDDVLYGPRDNCDVYPGVFPSADVRDAIGKNLVRSCLHCAFVSINLAPHMRLTSASDICFRLHPAWSPLAASSCPLP